MTARRTELVLGLALLVAGLLAPLLLPPFLIRVAQTVLMSAGLAIAWSLLGGFAGYWSFGHTVFIGVGAFAAALFEDKVDLGHPAATFLAAMVFGAIACAVLAALVAYPILRLRGIYFAIAMLGVGQFTGEVVSNVDAFQGAVGISSLAVAPESIEPAVFFYYLMFAATSGVLVVAYVVRYSRLGYGLLSIREDEDAARMLGVPTERYKIAVFILSAVLVGIIGVIYGHSLGFITSGSVFRTDFSLNMIVQSLLGGMGTLIGPIIGSLLMVVLTQVLLGRFLDVHMMMTGALLVAMVLLAPRGLVGFVRDYRERRRGRASS
jgi:branched-chain amino acid transport system permease protein